MPTLASEWFHKCGNTNTMLTESWNSWETWLLEIHFCEVLMGRASSAIVSDAYVNLPTCRSFSRSWISHDFWLMFCFPLWRNFVLDMNHNWQLRSVCLSNKMVTPSPPGHTSHQSLVFASVNTSFHQDSNCQLVFDIIHVFVLFVFIFVLFARAS